jgi:hypothetical protein
MLEPFALVWTVHKAMQHNMYMAQHSASCISNRCVQAALEHGPARTATQPTVDQSGPRTQLRPVDSNCSAKYGAQ